MAYNPKNTIKKEYSQGTPGHIVDAKYFYFDKPKGPRLKVLCGGYEKCASDFDIKRNNFPFFALIYIVKGKGVFRSNNKIYPLNYGSLIAFESQSSYQLTADTTVPMELYFLLYDGSKAKEYLKKSKIAAKGVTKVSNPEAIASNFRQILQIGLDHLEYAHEICCNYLKAILLTQADDRYDKFIKSSSYENFIRCKSYIENNFIHINTSRQIAEQCNLNIRYVARLFRKYGQVRPYEYLVNLKMNKAANLLITTNFNVNQIAKMTGIDDAYNFSRIFKKKFKVAPTEYRKSLL